jgi:hypothetical protein
MPVLLSQIFSLRLSVTVTVILLALFATFSNSEIYPLAPYAMFSFPYYKAGWRELEVQLVDTEGHESLPSEIELVPWGEARLKVYLGHLAQEKSTDLIKVTLKEILIRQNVRYTKIMLVQKTWESLTVENYHHPAVTLVAEEHR